MQTCEIFNIFLLSDLFSELTLFVVPSFYRSFSDENINMINKCVYHSATSIELLYLMFLNILYSIQISEVAYYYADH